jgi:sec-independent protein translocase protein TatA
MALLLGPLSAPELLIILAIVVVLFGATRIGDIGKGIGRGIREFRQEIKDGDEPKSDEPAEDKVEATSASSSAASEEKPTSQTH